MSRINFRRPDWAEQARASEARKERRSASVAAGNRIRSRHYRMALEQLAAIHNAQNGLCANPGCRKKIKAVGRGRAIDVVTGKMLCKGCSIMVNIAEHNERRLTGLLTYVQVFRKYT
jgi:hypothetical protein